MDHSRCQEDLIWLHIHIDCHALRFPVLFFLLALYSTLTSASPCQGYLTVVHYQTPSRVVPFFYKPVLQVRDLPIHSFLTLHILKQKHSTCTYVYHRDCNHNAFIVATQGSLSPPRGLRHLNLSPIWQRHNNPLLVHPVAPPSYPFFSTAFLACQTNRTPPTGTAANPRAPGPAKTGSLAPSNPATSTTNPFQTPTSSPAAQVVAPICAATSPPGP